MLQSSCKAAKRGLAVWMIRQAQAGKGGERGRKGARGSRRALQTV